MIFYISGNKSYFLLPKIHIYLKNPFLDIKKLDWFLYQKFDFFIARNGFFISKSIFESTSGVTAVTPTNCPKSVRNRSVIKVFGGVFMLSRCFLDFSVGVGVFVTGLSQISSFFSLISRNAEWIVKRHLSAPFCYLFHICFFLFFI